WIHHLLLLLIPRCHSSHLHHHHHHHQQAFWIHACGVFAAVDCLRVAAHHCFSLDPLLHSESMMWRNRMDAF
ncbi:unnamed protein product, partial [Musa hybrid cultivar]